MRQKVCNEWEFEARWSEEFLMGNIKGDAVRLPHTVKELPLHYALPSEYEMLCGYAKNICISEEHRNKRVFLQFDGAAHIAKLYVNGNFVSEHRCGYTAFRSEITEFVNFGAENRIAVCLDTSENPAIPPFGFVVDYLTYGGLYREAWLEICEQNHIEDVSVTAAGNHVNIDITTSESHGQLCVRILDGESICKEQLSADRHFSLTAELEAWSTANPKLYTIEATLLGPEGETLDIRRERFGMREAEFRADGFYLNGEKLFLRGLNRHQSYPYIGYAAPERLQREDARILKQELHCNAVRTSHYPQSRHFIDECDRLGLLVFTEVPGWQHIGDEAWKQQALENLKEMILQYRNHPSIILWGVRINESQDDDDFYRRANELAHQLDPSRQTSGVRYLEKSSLLEDVYAFNDFSHTGDNPGVKPKRSVTPDMNKALLVSECNGHMYPTKAYDDFSHRQSHALRHARVMNDALADGQHAGMFGWCMFDYQTHKDFGSGDRICYHGVLDAFRNPKLAAAVYASQGEDSPVLEVGTGMDIGDYPAGNIGDIYAFTNGDEIRLYKNDRFVKTFRSEGWPGLPHGPILIDDTIGALLETEENFPQAKAELLRKCLVSAGKHGIANLPLKDKLGMAWAMLHYGMKFEDGVALYGKYVGNWGGEATRWRFEAIKDGKVIATQTKCPGNRLHIEARPGASVLQEGNTYDMTSVRIRIMDENENVANYAQIPIQLKTEGCISLSGPDVITAEGGMCGTYVRTNGGTGAAKLTICSPGLECVEIEFLIENEDT